MSDIEKIKKGLQCIVDGTVRCESCGYAIDKHGHHSCQQNCASDAIAVLKEQEAEPVIQREVLHLLFWCCGSCGSPLTDGDKFCRKCGRPVKWE